MATTAKPATLASAMADAFAEIEAATKSANNPHFKSKYADLGAVIEAIKPALINHGLFFTQHPEPTETGVCIETVLHHREGQSVSLGKLFVPADKHNAQGFGSALTYARRYGLMTAFGVPAEDDDGNAAAKSVNGSKSNGKISDDQYATIVTLIERYGADTKRFLKYFEVDTVNELPAAQYNEVVAALNEYWKTKQAKNGSALKKQLQDSVKEPA